MMCILRLKPIVGGVSSYESVAGEIEGWIIATDMHDARRQAEAAGQRDLAELCYRMEWMPPPGKHEIRDFLFLVS